MHTAVKPADDYGMPRRAGSGGKGVLDVDLRRHLDGLIIGMRGERFSWWTHWREIAEYLLPRRYRWLVAPNQPRGSMINQKIIDDTATLAYRVLSSGMMSGITSPGRQWIHLTLQDDELANDNDVKLWLDEVTKRMLHIIADSNFYNSAATIYEDLGAFGTAVMIIDEDFEDVIRCYVASAGEYYLQNGERMEVDIMAREYTLNVRQVVKLWGLNAVSETVKTLFNSGGESWIAEVKIGHCIEPNPDYTPGSPFPKARAYRESYWEMDTVGDRVLAVRYRHEKPFMAPRWGINANDAYGRSPAMDALGDIKMLQVAQKRKAQGIDKMVNPPMLADTAMKNQPASMIPGGVTYVPNAANSIGFKPVYEVKPDLQYLSADIAATQARIKTTFSNDLFLMISQLDTVRTATEIDARKEEKLIQLGPVLERFESEFLTPAIDRIFAIMSRAKLIPPVPSKLKGGTPIKVEYVSMLAASQKAVATAAIERLAQFVGNLAGAVPGALDTVDWDEMIDDYADKLQCSPTYVRSLVEIAKIRNQRNQQQAQQQSMQNSLAAVQGAQGLSQVQVGGGRNAVQAALGQ